MSSRVVNGSIWILIAISAVSLIYIFVFQSVRGLSLVLEAPEQILSGVPFDLKVNFSNSSGATLEDVRLNLTLPEGAAFFGSDPQKNIDNKSLGNMGNGSLTQESYKIIIFSSEEGAKELQASVSYSSASLGSRFEKKKSIGIRVKSSGVLVEMSVPEKVVSGEEFPIAVSYRNVSDIDFSDLRLALEYPPNFSFASADLNPDSSNANWLLGDLRKNSGGKFIIKGSLIGNEGDSFEFKSSLFSRSAGQEYLVNKNSAKAGISSSPLSVSVHLNNAQDYSAKLGDSLNYTVSLINTTSKPIREVIVRVQLSGEMFDLNTVQTQGAFRAYNNTIIWNSGNWPGLALLSPGSAGAVNFSVKVKNNYLIRRFSDKNFVLRVSAEAESPTQVSDSAGNTFSKNKLETKVSGNALVESKAYFRDAGSGFLNKGIFPPKAGEPTDFTVHWVLKNSASDISGVEVKATLGNNVKMVGGPKSNAGSLPAYNPGTNEIVWQIDKIQANQGIIGDPIEAIFQIEAMPSAQNAGKYMALIGETSLSAKDEWTGQELNSSSGQITTALPDDPTVGQQGGVIQP